MAHRVFENTLGVEPEAPTFELEGRKFECLPEIGGGPIADVARATANGRIGTGAAVDFIRACLVPASEPMWDELMYSKTLRISKEAIWEVFEFLTEQYFRRPTQRPSDSPDGSQQTQGS